MLVDSIDTYVEMFLRPVSTGVYNWITMPAPLVSGDVVITDGNQNLNSEPGSPNRCRFTLPNDTGDLTRKNPLGAFSGSMGLGVQTRLGVLSIEDQFGRSVASTDWGAVGNAAGDVWTNGGGSGGTVQNSDWSVSGGTARHLVPVADGYRFSRLSSGTRLYRNVERHVKVRVPTATVTGTAGMSTDIYLRTVDLNNATYASVLFHIDGSVRVSVLDRNAGTARILSSFLTVPGLNLATTGQDYEIRCQVESTTVRAKVWQAGQPEPIGWHVTGYGATLRSGYVGTVSTCLAGNTNAPITWQYDFDIVRIPMFAGEITDLEPSGDGKASPKVAQVQCAGLLDRLQTGAALAESPMRRARSRPRRWLYLASPVATGGSVRTFTAPTANLGGATVGDFFFLGGGGAVKEDTKFTIISTSVAGSNTTLQFSPDAREAVVAGDDAQTFRGLTQGQQAIAYWPCEEGDGATLISSGLVGGLPLSITGPAPKFASESGFAASKPVLQLNDAELRALIPEYTTGSTALSINFLLSMPSNDESPATGTDILQWYTTGSGWSYDLRYTANGNGSFQLLAFNSTLTQIFDSGQIDFTLRGNKQLVALVLEESGGAVTYRMFTIREDGSVGGVGPATVTGATTLGKITDIRANPGGGYKNVGFGHLTVAPGVWDYLSVAFEYDAWINERALKRYQRLSFEDGVPITFRDDWDVITTPVGEQRVQPIGTLLKDPARSDDGLLHGMRGANVIEYITRGALTNQAPIVTIPASNCKDLQLLSDYTDITNRVSVTREGGGTATAERTAGPLSTQDPPSGVGVREQAFQLTLRDDGQTTHHANWRLGRGTIDQYRAPSMQLSSVGATSISLETLLSLGVGDRVDITGLEYAFIYDALPQLVVGVSIRLGNRFYPQVELVTVPYEVFNTLAITGDRYARPDAVDTTTGSTLTTTQTGSLTLVSASGAYPGTVDPADFPMDVMIGGERITLSAIVDTAVAGTQTATISARSVNGVVKAHSVGEDVVLAEPNYWQSRS